VRTILVTIAAVLVGLVATAAQGRGRESAQRAIRPGGINVEPSMRPWRYVGANPDGWWCRPGACNGVANGTVFVDRELRLQPSLHACRAAPIALARQSPDQSKIVPTLAAAQSAESNGLSCSAPSIRELSLLKRSVGGLSSGRSSETAAATAVRISP
jgi:hypothetical protein